MKTCLRCLDKRALCNKCKAKLKSGELTKIEINLERTLHRLSKTNNVIRGAEVLEVIDADSVLIVTGRGSARKLIGPSGQTLHDIAKVLKRHIRIIEEPKDSRDFLNKIIGSTAILGVNILYTPEGETFRISVRKSFKNRLPLQPETFSQVAKKLIGKNMELVFE